MGFLQTSVADPWHFGARIRGSVFLNNGSGSGCFRNWPSRCQQNLVFSKFFCLLLFDGTFTLFFKCKKSLRSHKTVESRFFLLFLHEIEGSGAGYGAVPLSNSSGSRRPINIPYGSWRSGPATLLQTPFINCLSFRNSFNFLPTVVIIFAGWRNGCWRSSSWPTARTFWRMLSGRSATTTMTSPWSESGQCPTSVLMRPACREDVSREYWMIYRGTGFLAVVWFGSSPTPLSTLCPQQVVPLSLSSCVSPVGS